jgi:hypothetical protein
MCDPDSIKPEPIPGLPEELPEGERILWRGGPDWKSLAMHVFHVRAVAIYFAVIGVWKVWGALADGAGSAGAANAALTVLAFAAAALGIMSLLAWLIARSTIYTVTTARVVIRAGVALPKAINIPFGLIGSAGLTVRPSGDGDIPLQLTGPDRLAYLHLWPHARPWRLTKAEPMLRGVPEAARCAEILAEALAEHAGQPAARIAPAETARPRSEPRSEAMPGRAAALNT